MYDNAYEEIILYGKFEYSKLSDFSTHKKPLARLDSTPFHDVQKTSSCIYIPSFNF